MNHDASGKRERKYNQNRKACIWYFTAQQISKAKTQVGKTSLGGFLLPFRRIAIASKNHVLVLLIFVTVSEPRLTCHARISAVWSSKQEWMISIDKYGRSLNILATASRWLRPPSMRPAKCAMPSAMMALHTMTGKLPSVAIVAGPDAHDWRARQEGITIASKGLI